MEVNVFLLDRSQLFKFLLNLPLSFLKFTVLTFKGHLFLLYLLHQFKYNVNGIRL
jgi:hypothetical protein